MTPADVAKVLAKAAAFDQRTVGEADVLAWYEVIGDLDVADALAAISRHYREHAERVMPADVIRIVAEIERERRREARLAREAGNPEYYQTAEHRAYLERRRQQAIEAS